MNRQAADRERRRFRLQLLALGLMLLAPIGLYIGVLNGVAVLTVVCMVLVACAMAIAVLVS